MCTEPIIACGNLGKSFQDGGQEVAVLSGIDLSVAPGEMIAIMGASGSGKSTLLHLLGGLDVPSQGWVKIEGQGLSSLSEVSLASLRNQKLGFVYQFHHLLPEMNCIENVAMPLLIGGMSVHEAKAQAFDILSQVGLSHRLNHKHGQLSGGERQRVALARAMVTRPACILADEPTGNLDARTAIIMMDLMLALNASCKTALLVVTHDATIAGKLDKSFMLTEKGLEPYSA